MKHDNRIAGVLYSADGHNILPWSFDGKARLWNASDGKAVGKLMKHESGVFGAHYSPGQRMLTWTKRHCAAVEYG